MLCGQARIVLRYSLISATTLSDRASAHSYFGTLCLVLRYSLISATTLSVSASTLLLGATALQYCKVSSDTHCVMSYSFIITDLGIPLVI